MAGLPQTLSDCRAQRLRLKDDTAAVLRFNNGQRIVATLRVVSTTGGLLSVPQFLIRGSRVTVRFLAGCDSVLGNAEMLCPINEDLQPFRFISLAAEAYLRLERSSRNNQVSLNTSEPGLTNFAPYQCSATKAGAGVLS